MNTVSLPSEDHLVSKTPSTFWSTNQIRITGEGPEGALSMELNQPCAIIGTHKRSELVLQGNRVARRHLYLHATDAGIYCVNLAKARRDQLLTGAWLRNGQTVQVGPYRLQFGFVSGKALKAGGDADDLLAKRSVARPFPLMLCSADDSPLGNRFLSRRLSFIGRDPFCTFQFVTRSMSPQHSVIYQQEGQIWIVDLKSSSKTLVNGHAARVARLVDNSVVKMGRVSFSIQRRAETDRGPRWKPEKELPADSVHDLEDPDDALQTAVTTSSEQPGNSPSASIIMDTDISLDLLPGDDNLVSDGSDQDLQLDVNASAVGVSAATADAESPGEEFQQTSQYAAVASPVAEDVQQRQTELDTLANELERRSENLIRQEKEWQDQHSQIQQELEQRSRSLDERNQELDNRSRSLDEREQAFHNQQKEFKTREQIAEAENRERDEKSRSLTELSKSLTQREQDVEIAESRHEEQLAAFLLQKSEMDKRFSELQNERERFELQVAESTARASQRQTVLNDRESELAAREKALEEAQAEQQRSETQANRAYESEKKQWLAQIAELQIALNESKQESDRQIASLKQELSTKQHDDRKTSRELEQKTAELQQRQSDFEEQQQKWQDEQRRQEIEHQASVERLQTELRQLANQKLEIQKEREVVQRNLAESEDRVRELADLELQRNQLAEDQARLEAQRDEFGKKQKQWCESQQQQESEARQQIQKMRDELTMEQNSLAADQKALQQAQVDFEQRQRSWLAEQNHQKEQMNMASDQLQERQTRLANEAEEFKARQQAWLEDSTASPTEVDSNEDLQLLRQELDSERARFAEQRSQWELERERQAEEAAASAEKLEEQKAALVAAQEKLQTDLREFDRYVTIGRTQQQVLNNLKQMKREKSTPHRFWSWLFGRKD